MIDRRYHPSPSTGIDALRPAQRDLLLDYVNLAVKAKDAGVHGEALKSPQRFVDSLVLRRIADAADPALWRQLAFAMQLEMNRWQKRMADHARRDAHRSEPGVVGAHQAADILAYAQGATSDQLSTMERLLRERDTKDVAVIRELWPQAIRPDRCTMAARGLQRVIPMDGWDRVAAFADKQPRAVKQAMAGVYGGEHLPRPMHAALLGPWAAVMEGDPSLLMLAAGEEAQRLHRDLLSLPREAFETEEMEWQRHQDDLDDMPF